MRDLTPPPPSRLSRTLAAVAWLVAAGGAIAVLLIAAAVAEGGTYRVTQCNPGAGAGQGDFTFRRSSEHYRSAVHCSDGEGLIVRHDARRTKRSKWGAWTLDAPAGARITSVRARAAGTAGGGHVPELLIGLPGEATTPLGRISGTPRTATWRGESAQSFQARLRCGAANCSQGLRARVLVRRVNLRLEDRLDPSAAITGAFAQGDTRRGMQTLATAVGDSGSGVRRVFVEVNGKPLAARRLPCDLVRRIATRLHPCPASAEPSFTLDTDSRGFQQGMNRIRICVDDFALSGLRNRTCERRRARIDNECPVDDAASAGKLHARIAGGERALRRGRPARVAGRLTDPNGRAMAGAQVCVATRTATPDAVERVVATPRTDVDGRFSARLAAGPSREVRLAHWAGTERVAERHLRLRVRARPELHVGPRRTLRNGERVHFGVRLHGPHAETKRFRIEVRAAGGWVPVRAHVTNRAGRWNGGYRFRSTTGRRTYRFRAIVPRQPRYPYERGASAVRRVRVSG